MGSRIAAHFANAGIPALLLDIVLPNQPNRNAAALGGLDATLKQKPAAFFTAETKLLVTPGNFEDDLAKIRIVTGSLKPSPRISRSSATCSRK